MKIDSQPTLFDLNSLEKKERRKPQKRMHVIDAGPGEGDWHMVAMQCGRCELKTGWFPVKTITEAKAGIPCPKCACVAFDIDEKGEYIVPPGEFD